RCSRGEILDDRIALEANARVGRAGDERETVDDLATRGPVVTRAQPVDDHLRSDLRRAVADHRVVALVLARQEVLRRTAIVGAREAAAVVPVGACEEPVVPAFTE